MKRKYWQLTIMLITFLPLSMKAMAAAETYTLDPNHSYVLWHVNHFGFSNVSGKWYVNGMLILDQDNLKKSGINVTIKVADLSTGLKALDEHLTSKDFFDVSKFPTAIFVSNKIYPIDKTSAKVYGTLTIHGVSKPVVLNMKLNKSGVNPIINKPTVGFSGYATVNRSEFGISQYLPAISDQVKLEIEVEANKLDNSNTQDKK